jgi:hypothetical protein
MRDAADKIALLAFLPFARVCKLPEQIWLPKTPVVSRPSMATDAGSTRNSAEEQLQMKSGAWCLYSQFYICKESRR